MGKSAPYALVWRNAIRDFGNGEGWTGATKSVAYTLHTYMDNDAGTCHPGLERIASGAGVRRETASRALTRLSREGWLLKQHRPNRSNHYRALIPDWVSQSREYRGRASSSHPARSEVIPGQPRPELRPHPTVTEAHGNSPDNSPEDSLGLGLQHAETLLTRIRTSGKIDAVAEALGVPELQNAFHLLAIDPPQLLATLDRIGLTYE